MKNALFIMILAAVVLLSACGTKNQSTAGKPTAQPAEVHKLTAEEAHTRMQSGDELVILDVRTAEEYESAHIPGAVLLPNEDIGTTPPAALPVLDTEILVYCRSGNRSAQAAKKLADMGYTRVYDFGGINSWSYETEKGPWQGGDKAGTLSSFTAADMNGAVKDESIFAPYKVTMINIWATYCGPCLREMPDLGTLAAKYADKGVQIVGIPVDVQQNSDGTFDSSSLQNARDIVSQTGAKYTHLLPSSDLVAAILGGVDSVPTTIFVDSTGKQLGKAYIGSRSQSAWETVIDDVLKGVD